MSTMAGIDNCTIVSNIYILDIDGCEGYTPSSNHDNAPFIGNLNRRKNILKTQEAIKIFGSRLSIPAMITIISLTLLTSACFIFDRPEGRGGLFPDLLT